MRPNYRFLIASMTGLFVCSTAVIGQQPQSSSPARQAASYLYSASTFGAHAKDHANILSRYATANQAVPKELAEQQTAAIRRDVEAAKHDIDTLKTISKSDQSLEKRLKELEGRLAEIEKSRINLESTCDQMLTATRDQSKTGAATMHKCCTTMQKEIQVLNAATTAVVNNFRQQEEVERMWQQLKTESD